MTKYILHGGKTSRKSKDNNKFFLEMTKGVKEPMKILCVYFAREKEAWDKLFDQDKEHFSSVAPTKVLELERADDNPKIFKAQIRKSDVVYMRGGVTEVLMSKLKPIKNFGELIKTKVVSGSSAGACVLSRFYHTGSHKTHAKKGLGILPIKTFVHYFPEKQEELKELENLGQKLTIYKIPEERFVIVRH